MSDETFDSPTRMAAEDSQHGTAYVALLAGVAALGGLLFGYDTAVISGAIGYIQTHFALDSVMKGWAASSALLGCVMGAAVAGTLSDRFGRKKILLLTAVLFALSAIGSAFPRTLWQLVTARIVGGVGVGMAAMLSPIYIAEVAPARIRGRLVSINQFAIIAGMLVVYFVNSQIAGSSGNEWNVTTGWRWMFGSETLPAALFLFLLLLVPESPRWLAKQNRTEQALRILTRIGGSEHARQEIKEVQQTLNLEKESVGQLFQPAMRAPLILAVGLAVLQQITGINTVLYYAPEIFKSTGLQAAQAIGDTVLVGVVNLLFTIVAILIVDRVGRRPLLLVGSAGMGLSLVLMAAAIMLQQEPGLWVLLFMLCYVAAFAVAMGPVVWVVISEVLPNRTRGRAMSLATVCLWLACFAVSQTFPFLLEKLGGGAFFIYAIMCVLAFIFVRAMVPETKGRSLEEIEKSWLANKQ